MTAREFRLARTARLIAMALALGAACVAPLAARDAPAHPCARVVDDDARLRCYDDAFGKGSVPPSPAADAMAARVTAVEHRAQGQFVASLDNGQKWMQSEITSKVQVAVGDVVTVRRAALGSYLLTGSQGIATRVKRVD